MGANDYEFGAIQDILRRLDGGEITVDDALAQAETVRDSKNAYH